MAVLEKQEILNLAEKAVKLALSKGASEAEAYVYEGESTSIGIELGQISKTNRIIDSGLGIRVSVNKAIGFAYTNAIDNQDNLESIISNALSAAKASNPDDDWKGLPQRHAYTEPKNTFDNKIAQLDAQELVSVASVMLDAAGQVDKRVFPVEGGVGSANIANAIVNSSGIIGFDCGTIVECSLATLANDGSTVTPVCFEFNSARKYNIDPAGVGKKAGELAVSALKTKSSATRTTKVIFTQFALQDLLGYTLINAVKADSVQRNQSPFKGKIGQKVASENLTIFDDGLFDGGMRTWMFDAEGVPQQKTAIIEQGILKGFLYDNYSAQKEGRESTGNALRAGYLSTPTIGATNFRIMPGDESSDGLLSEVDDGLIVYYLQGAHSSNPVSGEFSVVATPAWQIKNGKIIHACKGVMLAGNIFELLGNVRSIANNERQIGQLVSPWILVDNVRVIGK